ncbi:MAG TPA: DUF6412 domain-containing protein [Actinoplanes sp.]|nr:DUF6412 domain-containing protein [Actinoplanes sp.]
MLLWALAILLSPTPDTSALVLGLAVVAAAVLIALAAAGVATRCLTRTAGPPVSVRSAHREPSRLLDPDAPGRPRPRAPAAYPTAA